MTFYIIASLDAGYLKSQSYVPEPMSFIFFSTENLALKPLRMDLPGDQAPNQIHV